MVTYTAAAMICCLSQKCFIYASPTSGEACRDRQLTTNFEIWVEIFCVPTCFHVRIPKPCLSVCPYPEKRNYPGFVNISSTLVIDTSMERFSQVLHHGSPKIKFFFFKSSNFDLWRRAEITLASSISVAHWQLIHQWKGLHEYYDMPMENVNFIKLR